MSDMTRGFPVRADAVGVCLIAKNEARYLVEWVAYYRALGFDRLLIYDNASTDTSMQVLNTFAGRDDAIVVVPWPDRPEVVPQLTAYKDALARSGCEWLAFFDADELLVLKQHGDIQAFLARYPQTAGAVAVNWLLFGSSSQKSYSSELQARRFRMCARNEPGTKNRFVKSIVRVAAVETVKSHTAKLKPGFEYYDDTGRPAKLLGDAKTELVSHEYAQLNHYVVRSLEEYREKQHRGNAARALEAPDKFSGRDDAFWKTHSTNHLEDVAIDAWVHRAAPFRRELRSWLAEDGVEIL